MKRMHALTDQSTRTAISAFMSGATIGQSVPKPQESPPPPLPSHLQAELRAMNERMTSLQTSVDDILWILSQARLDSIHQPHEPYPRSHPSPPGRQRHTSRDPDRHQTRAPPPQRVGAWAATRGAAPQAAELHRSTGYVGPTSPKQVLSGVVFASSVVGACSCTYLRTHAHRSAASGLAAAI